MKTDREMLDEAMRLLLSAMDLGTRNRIEWWDDVAKLRRDWMASRDRYLPEEATPDAPAPEPFVTRQELFGVFADIAVVLAAVEGRGNVDRAARVGIVASRLALGEDARGDGEVGEG